MKSKFFTFGLIFAVILLTSFTAAANTCSISTKLINQDPYPAIPGDYVKLVFQVSGASDPTCGRITHTLIEEFPFSLDPGVSPTKSIQGGTYAGNDFRSHWIIPYRIRLDEQAIDGENTLDTSTTFNSADGSGSTVENTFTIEVDASDTDFEVSIRDYQPSTNTLTFEILNTGENDVEALTIEIPNQPNINVKGTNRNIVGGLDSNDDTTFTFEATPSDGQINLKILYTDTVNVRRELEKSIIFNSAYFENRASDEKTTSPWFYITLIILLLLAVKWYLKRRKDKKKKHTQHHSRK